MMEVFGHEAHAGVEERLLDARSSQGRVEEGHQDLEDSRELPGDQWRSLQQSGFQQTHHTLQLHVQLKTATTTQCRKTISQCDFTSCLTTSLTP